MASIGTAFRGKRLQTAAHRQATAFQHRGEHGILRQQQLLLMQLQGDIKQMPAFFAFRKNMNDVLSLAKAHVERRVLEQFIAKVQETESSDPQTATRLKRLCDFISVGTRPNISTFFSTPKIPR